MADCEICGRASDIIYVVDIEGAEMGACARCSRGKKVIETIGSAREENSKPARRPAAKTEEYEITDGYGVMIRRAREAMGLPMKTVAEKINEKESTLRRVEEGKMQPNDSLVKRLEKELGIRLMVKSEGDLKVSGIRKNEPITLWDAAIRKDKKQ